MKEKIAKFLKEEGIILPKDFVVEVYSQILKFAGPLSGLIRKGSNEAGKAAAKSLRNKVDLSKDELPEILKEFFLQTGFGNIDISISGDVLSIEVKDSFLLRAHPDESKALSPLVGAIEGFVEEFIGKGVKVKQEGKRITVEL
ncbi:MAG: hypothetical protein ABIL50_01700 [candidate division WOR-3 bacterium]